MFDSSLLIPAIIIGAVIIIIIMVLIFNRRKNTESEASILDVNEVGVPSTLDANDFSYGYEKEETIVMNAVNENQDEKIDEETKVEEEKNTEEE